MARGGATTVYLVDASPYIFRAYFSLPDSLSDGEGKPANAVYGFAAFLLKLLEEERPSHLGVAFDESLTTSFRNDLYPDYKAQRELPPPELEAQLESCQELARGLGAAVYVSHGYEADDLIGTLAERLVEAGAEVVVVTSDKDLTQLVGARVALLDFAAGARYGPAEVREKFGARPEQIADLLALAGDPVDNIPGVEGIGRKTAAALLAHFESIEDLFRRLEVVEGLPLRGARSVRAKLAAGREKALLSKRLARVALDAPVDADLEGLLLRGPESEVLEPLLERLGSERLRRRISRWSAALG